MKPLKIQTLAASLLAILITASAALAADPVKVTITGDDQMKFDVTEIWFIAKVHV